MENQRTLPSLAAVLAMAATVLVDAAAPRASAATPILDQQQTNISPPRINNGGRVDVTWEQGVFAGLAGTLTQIDLNFTLDPVNWPNAKQVEVFVNLGDPWQSDANDFSGVFTVAEGWNSLDVSSANIPLAVGTPFVIGIRGVGPAPPDPDATFYPGFRLSHSDVYPGAIYLNGSEWCLCADLGFRTYVDAGAAGGEVPEPATFALFASGLSGLVLRRLRGVRRPRAQSFTTQ